MATDEAGGPGNQDGDAAEAWAVHAGRLQPPILLRGAEGNISEVAFSRGAGMLGVDLQADTLHAARRFFVSLLVILQQVVSFRKPSIQLLLPGAPTQAKNIQQGNEPAVFPQPFC